MKTTLFRLPVMSVFFLLFLCANSLIADVVWDGASTPSSMKSSSDGSSLIINGSFGDIELDTGPTTIYANTEDIIVTLQANPVVRGHKHKEAQLILRANEGRKIIFVVENDDLTFQGSRGHENIPLLMYAVPGSEVDFVINGNHHVAFTAAKNSGAGVMFYVGMSEDKEHPTKVSFIRNPFAQPDQNVGINIGRNSLLTFANQKGFFNEAVIRFDGTAPAGSTGRMILHINPAAGFVIRSSAVIHDIVRPSGKYKPKLADIDNALLGYGFGKVEVVNSGEETQASLQVVNKNNRLFDLLADPFFTLDTRNDLCNGSGLFSGVQYGFVLGSQGILDVQDNAFFDYVGLTNNVCPLSRCFTNTGEDCCPIDCCITNTAFNEIHCFEGFDPESITKQRNPSAFFVDGSNVACAAPAEIHLGEHSAIFFRSGVDKNGHVAYKGEHQYTINPSRRTPGIGEIVFDVEGPLQVRGSNHDCDMLSKLEILSLEVAPTGGPLVYNSDEVIFPERTCERVDCCYFRQYNSAAFLINNRMELFNSVLVHTDQNHKVVRNNDLCSEPAYVGGEIGFLTEGCGKRPQIVFYNSNLFVHTDVAFTGLDLLVPNLAVMDNSPMRKKASHCAPCQAECPSCDFCSDPDDCGVIYAFPQQCVSNISQFRFFYNGNKLDNGIGRQMILGTKIGSFACDGSRVISADAHLDVIPEVCCNESGGQVQQLLILNTDANTPAIICQLDDEDIIGQFSQQTIFLGNASNISIGEQVNNQENCL